MKRMTKILLAAWLTFVVVGSGHAFGRKDELTSPSVGIPTSLPQADQDTIRKALRSEDCTFISGTRGGKTTRLHYKSDTAALNKFLSELAACSSVKVYVSFYRAEDAEWAPPESNWSVIHLNTMFSVTIRLDSEIDLTELHIPPLHSERKE